MGVKHMKTYLKKSIILSTSLLLVLMTVGLVHADSDHYDFTNVEINDLLFFDGTTILQQELNLLQEEFLKVKFTLQANETIFGGFVDPVFCSVDLEGYEYGKVSTSIGPFSVEEGKLYQKTLSLQVPEDIDTSESYTIRLECSDQIDQEEIEFTVFLNEVRHNVKIFDTLLNPSNQIGAGKPLFVTVRLENLGEKQEDDIKVTASVKELGISVANYLGELVTLQQEEDEEFLFEEEAQGQIELLLRMPDDAPSGTYTLNIDVEYNRGHSKVSQQLPLTVVGLPDETPKVDTVINIDSTSKEVTLGQTVDYKLMIANLGSEKGVYLVQTEGISWGSASVNPGFLTVLGESTGEVTISVTPNEGAVAQDYVFVARVLLGNDIVNEITLNTKVKSDEETNAGAALTFKMVLGIIFGILVIILVVLGLIIAFKKDDTEDEDAPSPSVAQGQTYYYTPKK